MKIVINRCYGGFSLSEAVYKELSIFYDGYEYMQNEDLEIESDNYMVYRSDTRLVTAIGKIGLKESSGHAADLEIVEIPDDIEWYIDDYDGIETVHEEHRSW